MIEAVRPEIDAGRFPAKRAVGDTVVVSAAIFAEGHDRLAGVLRHRHTGDPDDPDCWYLSASSGPGAAHRSGNAQAVIYRWRGDGPWQALSGGLPQPLDSFPYALTFVGRQLYAGLGDGRIYTSQDAGDSWQQLELRGELPERVQAIVGVA